MMTVADTSQPWCETMTNENRELNVEELGCVTGGGLVDTVLPDAEATTAAFLKQFAEASVRFNTFINTPTGPAPTAPQE
jgi:hypothetical protein